MNSLTHLQLVARGLDRVTFDTALPQPWVDTATARTGKNPVGHVVWAYPSGSVFGHPRALDIEGDIILGMLAGAL